jgi:hypothetical protein
VREGVSILGVSLRFGSEGGDGGRQEGSGSGGARKGDAARADSVQANGAEE